MATTDTYKLILDKLLSEGYHCLVIGINHKGKIVIYQPFELDEEKTMELLNAITEVKVMSSHDEASQ